MPGQIVFSARQLQFIRDHWGKLSLEAMAERLHASRSRVSIEGRRLGLDPSKCKGNSPLWTAEDIALFRRCIAEEMTAREINLQHFPARTFDGVKEMRKRLMRGTVRAERQPKPRAPRNLRPGKAEDFVQKPQQLVKLEYTLDECPRVSLRYAIQWAQQANKNWQAPEDEKQAWLQINAMRLFGKVPVPPFLPAARRVPDDLPNWDVEIAA